MADILQMPFSMYFINQNCLIFIELSLKFVSHCPNSNKQQWFREWPDTMMTLYIIGVVSMIAANQLGSPRLSFILLTTRNMAVHGTT